MEDNRAINWGVTQRQFEGISLNTGVGLGRAVIHRSIGAKVSNKKEVSSSEANAEELTCLNLALNLLVEEVKALINQQSHLTASDGQNPTHSVAQPEAAAILNVYLMLANDPGWRHQLIAHVEGGFSAVEAVDKTLETIRKSLVSNDRGDIWKERISDFEDLSYRLKRHLGEALETTHLRDMNVPIIVVADRIGPAELLEYDRDYLTGLVLAEQSQTAHVAIVARSLDIPVVGSMMNAISEIKNGDSLLVDGNEGRLYLNPTHDVIQRYDSQSMIKKSRSVELRLEKLAELPSQTLDGVKISLNINAGLVEDVDHLSAAGAEGVGLFRTEIPFMMRSKLPNVTEQINLYRDITTRAGNYPVVFRTLDVGGDKVLPYLEKLKPRNLMLEERITRVFFDRPHLLRYQLRALIRACEGKELRIMLPMVAEVGEVKTAREVLENEIERERSQGNLVPSKILLGAMIEIPSIICQLAQLIPYIDFLSVGSNDLFQYFYAIDRDHPKLANRYDVLSATFLCLLQRIQQECSEAGIPLSVCGEMASRPLEALALIGLGYRSLSMSAASIPIVKAMVRSVKYTDIAEYMAKICEPGQGSIRQHLLDFLSENHIRLE